MERLVDKRSPWATRISPGNVQSMQLSHLENQFNRFTLLMSPMLTLINWLQANIAAAAAAHYTAGRMGAEVFVQMQMCQTLQTW